MTLKDNATYGKPPKYPSSQQFPPEYWRKQPDGNPAWTQTITIETPTGPQKRAVVPGWDNPVYLGPEPEDEN